MPQAANAPSGYKELFFIAKRLVYVGRCVEDVAPYRQTIRVTEGNALRTIEGACPYKTRRDLGRLILPPL